MPESGSSRMRAWDSSKGRMQVPRVSARPAQGGVDGTLEIPFRRKTHREETFLRRRSAARRIGSSQRQVFADRQPSNRAGSCQARVMPRFARPEMDRAVISSPWKTIFRTSGNTRTGP